MRTATRLAIASGGAILLSFAAVPMALAMNGADDPATDPSNTTTTSTTTGTDTTTDSTSTSGSTTETTGSSDSTSTTSGGGSSAEIHQRIKERTDKIKAEATAKADDIKQQAELRKTNAKATGQAKLAEAKLKVCEQHATIIDGLMTRIGDRGQKQLELVTTIVTRVEAYKTDKNLTVANYDALTAEVAAQKAAAETSITATKAVKTDFKCDGSDPKGAASVFKDGMKVQNAAIKAYRDAAKKLLVAIKQAQGPTTTNSANTSGTNTGTTPSTTTSGDSTGSN